MARIYPSEFPASSRSSGERAFYRELSRQLSDDYRVVYGTRWLVRDRRNHDLDGEIDFLIIHPDAGILVLEVKGGRIRIDDQTDQWFSIDKNNHEFVIKNPFAQALSNLHKLRAKLQELPAVRGYSLQTQHAVVFPDITVDGEHIGLYGPRELIIDSADMGHLNTVIPRLMPRRNEQSHIPGRVITELVSVLKPRRELSRLSLGAQVRDSEQEILRLTEQQYQILEQLQLYPQAEISGCAGSGKTMLAIEKARSLASQGFRVLFTCFNTNLAYWIEQRFSEDPTTEAGQIRVQHYHGLARELCQTNGVAIPSEPSDPNEKNAYFTTVLPETLIDSLDSIQDRFDAIVVDEGQDFHDNWLLTLEGLLADESHGVFYVFIDDNQRIYSRHAVLPSDRIRLVLDYNCRNTEQIHELVVKYHRGSPKPKSRGPIGSEPQILPVQDPHQEHELRRVFNELFSTERIHPDDVIILSPRGRRTSTLTEGRKIGNHELTWRNRPEHNQVRVSSIHGFKGLESSIVILAEIDRITNTKQRDDLLYVAISRARNHLIVLGELPSPIASRGSDSVVGPSRAKTTFEYDDAGRDIQVAVSSRSNLQPHEPRHSHNPATVPTGSPQTVASDRYVEERLRASSHAETHRHNDDHSPPTNTPAETIFITDDSRGGNPTDSDKTVGAASYILPVVVPLLILMTTSADR